MDGPATRTASAISAAFRLLGRSIAQWLVPVVALAWLAAVPEALAERHGPEIVGMIVGRDGVDISMAGTVVYAALVALLGKLILDLVALQWAFTVLADVAAGREVSLTGGLRRMASWKLQFSWLISGTIVSAATGFWYVGGCLLLVPLGFAVAEAYEEDNGIAAIGSASALGFRRGPTGGWLGTPMFLASTLLLFGAFLVSCGVSLGSCLTSTGPDADALLALLSKVDPSRPDEFIQPLLTMLLPQPSWLDTAVTIALAPARQLVEVGLLAIQLVAYHHARTFRA